ncbi:hypothetical protein HPB49_013069 [Dermacentor silvarum]|uniref:Uncharacterized protein n=1 Tax=Dermacentor silvarum TaxID=543639 RepID=A0ACB8DD42_DERSI|nr:hypothetical protein HPB49_013069 [Dermacentor silvarum]
MRVVRAPPGAPPASPQHQAPPGGLLHTEAVDIHTCALPTIAYTKIVAASAAGKGSQRTSLSFVYKGFVAGVEWDTATQDPAPELPATVPDVSGDELIEDLRSSGVPIPATVNFGNFANVDSATVSCAELTDEEIVNEVLAPVEEDSDSEENATCAAGPTNGDLAQALAVLSSCFSEDVTLSQIQADLVLRKRNTVQQSIEQFFQPQVL